MNEWMKLYLRINKDLKEKWIIFAISMFVSYR